MYKRQEEDWRVVLLEVPIIRRAAADFHPDADASQILDAAIGIHPVSYTHLTLPTIGSVHVGDVVSCYDGVHTVGELWILATVMYKDGRVEDLACVSIWVGVRGGTSYYRNFKKRDAPIFLRLEAISGSLIYSMSDDGEIASCLIPAPLRSLFT